MSKTKQYLFEYICSAEYEEQLIQAEPQELKFMQQKYVGSKQPKSSLEGVKQEKQAKSIASLRSSLQKRFKRV